MSDLRLKFGKLLSAHRRRKGLTQEKLAELAGVSLDMISKLEIGKTGASFSVVERLAECLAIDPAELFSSQIPFGSLRSGPFSEISDRLAGLSEPELIWVKGVLDAALKDRG